MLYQGQHLFVFGAELVLLHAGELAQAHFHHGACLHVRQAEAFHQPRAGLIGRFRLADDADGLVQVVQYNHEALEQVRPFLGLGQVEAGAAGDHLVAVFHEVVYHVLQAQQAGAAMHQGDVVHAERRLHFGVLEQFVEHHVGVGVALDVHHDAHAFLVRLVVHVRYALDLLFGDQRGDVLDEFLLHHVVGNLVHHDFLASVVVHFDVHLRTDDNASAPGFVGFLHPGISIDVGSRGEVGCLDVFHQLVNGYFGVVNVGHDTVHHLAEVVRSHVGGHTHGDARRPVHQQVGDAGRQHERFLQGVVEVGLEVHRVLADVYQHGFGNAAQAGFGITHGRRAVVVHRPEVALPVHQRVAHGPRLRQPHQRAIDGRVAMRVVFPHDIAHDSRALLIRFIGIVAQLIHAEKHTALHRFQTIAHIGQRPRHDDRHGVVNVRRFHFFVNVHFDNSVLLSHLYLSFIFSEKTY